VSLCRLGEVNWVAIHRRAQISAKNQVTWDVSAIDTGCLCVENSSLNRKRLMLRLLVTDDRWCNGIDVPNVAKGI